MDKRKLIVRIFAGILAAILLLGLITPAFAAEAEGTQPQDSVAVADGEYSLGIIGGADGPTAIFVTTPFGGAAVYRFADCRRCVLRRSHCHRISKEA